MHHSDVKPVLVDVVIPYWGDPGYMKETVSSVLAQTSPDWRLTIIDDSYPDRTVQDWVMTLGDDRITYVRKPVNEGIIANFHSCLQAGRHELMAMPGSDDRLLPHYVEEIVRAHRAHPEAAIIQPGVRVIDERGHPTRTLVEFVKQKIVQPHTTTDRVLAGEALATNLLHGNWLYWPSLAFRTDRVQRHEFRDSFPTILDLGLILDMILDGEQLVVTPHEAFEYRRHSNSASSANLADGSRFAEDRRFFELIRRKAEARGWRRAARAARLHVTSRAHAAVVLPRALAARDLRAARVLLGHALRP